MKSRSVYSIFIILIIFLAIRFYGLYGLYIVLIFIFINAYYLNRRKIRQRIFRKDQREETIDKLLNQSAGNFYLAVDPENPDKFNQGINQNLKPKKCPNCGSDVIPGLNYCEECGFKLDES